MRFKKKTCVEDCRANKRSVKKMNDDCVKCIEAQRILVRTFDSASDNGHKKPANNRDLGRQARKADGKVEKNLAKSYEPDAPCTFFYP